MCQIRQQPLLILEAEVHAANIEARDVRRSSWFSSFAALEVTELQKYLTKRDQEIEAEVGLHHCTSDNLSFALSDCSKAARIDVDFLACFSLLPFQ